MENKLFLLVIENKIKYKTRIKIIRPIINGAEGNYHSCIFQTITKHITAKR